ncbi:MAG: GTP cyclohydrolase I type 1 [Firmicutes bacterium]|nr:GTP cyclohydrolase I type 1 [Bacillota bacterium]MDI6705831.1 GTP cyclohydrolase I FolE [Bacillota bacterium]
MSDRLERAVRTILEEIGEDTAREGLVDTPARVARMYRELFSGMGIDPASVLSAEFEEGYNELVIVKDIPFYSMCEHHLIPFFGHAHIGYVPNGKISGLSKLARLVEVVSRRPQLQERMVSTIADVMYRELSPQGVMVVIEAEHLCMTMRGVKKPGTTTVTSAIRGIFNDDASLRAEFLALIGRDKK